MADKADKRDEVKPVKVEAILANHICASCKYRSPKHTLIMVPIAPDPKSVVVLKSGLQQAMPMCTCENPESIYFLQMMVARNSCPLWEFGQEKKKKEDLSKNKELILCEN